MEEIKDYLESLEMPEWGCISKVKVEDGGILIRYSDIATIYISTEFEWDSGLKIENNSALGKLDLEFVLEVLNRQKEIISLLEEAD